MKTQNFIKSILIILAPLAGGIFVSIFTNSKSYEVINKPLLSPPSVVFPIAWTIIYLLMGISLLINLKNNQHKKSVLFFGIQLILNYIWPFLFFKFKIYIISALWILIMIYFVIEMLILFYKNNKIAGLLQIPYFIWLLFALYLNIGVALLN